MIKEEVNMSIYKVDIIETLKRTVTIEADSKGDALEEIQDKYWQGEIVLTADDYLETDFE